MSTFDNTKSFHTLQKQIHTHTKSFVRLDLAKKVTKANESINYISKIKQRKENNNFKKAKAIRTNIVTLESSTGNQEFNRVKVRLY
jgi:hypothetical protein